MQKNAKNSKNQREMVFKPYLKGAPWDGHAIKRGLKILTYYLVFVFLYLLIGSMLSSDNPWITWPVNLIMVGLCAALLYADGAREGESHVALGEIAYARKQNGKEVSEDDRRKCFHPAKGFVIMLCGVALLVIVCAAHAVTAQKQVYALQALPDWVNAYSDDSDVMRPLAYYREGAGLAALDILHVAGRLLIFPFAQIARMYGTDAVLLCDRLSPLLVCLPALGFSLGYLTGPRSRAAVHGDIKASNSKYRRRQRREQKQRRAQREKKNELI